jgi:hypothetical protein
MMSAPTALASSLLLTTMAVGADTGAAPAAKRHPEGKTPSARGGIPVSRAGLHALASKAASARASCGIVRFIVGVTGW